MSQNGSYVYGPFWWSFLSFVSLRYLSRCLSFWVFSLFSPCHFRSVLSLKRACLKVKPQLTHLHHRNKNKVLGFAWLSPWVSSFFPCFFFVFLASAWGPFSPSLFSPGSSSVSKIVFLPAGISSNIPVSVTSHSPSVISSRGLSWACST